jgi:hypothetical protein
MRGCKAGGGETKEVGRCHRPTVINIWDDRVSALANDVVRLQAPHAFSLLRREPKKAQSSQPPRISEQLLGWRKQREDASAGSGMWPRQSPAMNSIFDN